VNVSSDIEGADEMITAYWTAADAVKRYDKYGDGTTNRAPINTAPLKPNL
jgi:hypothetical protein